tara:strand:+ start:7774 stop:8118 length:345 start_codon:yes stop_codon:yes gene_type:complete
MRRNNIRLFSILLIFGLISFSNVSAQQSASEIDIQKLEEQKQSLEGTFQIEMINTRSLPTFHISLYDIIEEKRDEKEIVYHEVSDIMRIKILPRTVIEDKNFEPVERVVYTTSK